MSRNEKAARLTSRQTLSTDCRHYGADLAASGREAILLGLLRPGPGLYAKAIKQWRLMKEGLSHGKESGCCADPLAATRATSSPRPLCPGCIAAGEAPQGTALFFSYSFFFFFFISKQSPGMLSFLSFLSFFPSFFSGYLLFSPASPRVHARTHTHTRAHTLAYNTAPTELKMQPLT